MYTRRSVNVSSPSPVPSPSTNRPPRKAAIEGELKRKLIESDDGDDEDESGIQIPYASASPQAKSEVWKQQRILEALRKHASSAEFRQPYVSTAYLTAIAKPTDLESIQKKITEGLPFSDHDFDTDVELIFSNCEAFNLPAWENTWEVIEAGRKLKSFYREQKQKFKFCESHAAEELQKVEQEETDANKEDDQMQKDFAKKLDDIDRDVHTTEEDILRVEIEKEAERNRRKRWKRFSSVDMAYDDNILAKLDIRLTALNAELKQKVEQTEVKIKKLKQPYDQQRDMIRTKIENIHEKKGSIFRKQSITQLSKQREQRRIKLARLTLQPGQ